MRRRFAFTLVELLIVIGIIAILVSIIVPVVSSARYQANAVKCQHNLNTLWRGFTAFAADHENRLPGTSADSVAWTQNSASEPLDHLSWLGGQYDLGSGFAAVNKMPESGTIFKYVGHSYDAYRCPLLDLANNGGAGGTGGSNGRFDYTTFSFFSGCRMERLPTESRYPDPVTTQNVVLPHVPVIVEEDTFQANGSNIDSNHSNIDRLGTQHLGGSYYAATDGSVQYLSGAVCGVNASAWQALSYRRTWIGIGNAQRWGWWEKQ